MILTTILDPKLKIKNLHDITNLPQIVNVNNFDEESVKSFNNDMNNAINTKQEVIPVIIHSSGGSIYGLLAMISKIENSPVPVATICIGKCMSAGAVLLSCGSPGLRFMDKNAHLMIHSAAAGYFGKNEEIQAGAKQLNDLQNQIYSILSENCNKDKRYFQDLIQKNKNADWYLTPKECKKHNIIDHIAVPYFECELKLTNTFKWNKNGRNNTNTRTK